MNDESVASDDSTPKAAEVPSEPNLATPAQGSQTGRTQISGFWVGIIFGIVVLVFLLVFIIQNSQSVKVSFFTMSGNMPLGVALLLAVVGGVLVTGIVAALRIWLLRHRLHMSK